MEDGELGNTSGTYSQKVVSHWRRAKCLSYLPEPRRRAKLDSFSLPVEAVGDMAAKKQNGMNAPGVYGKIKSNAVS